MPVRRRGRDPAPPAPSAPGRPSRRPGRPGPRRGLGRPSGSVVGDPATFMRISPAGPISARAARRPNRASSRPPRRSCPARQIARPVPAGSPPARRPRCATPPAGAPSTTTARIPHWASRQGGVAAGVRLLYAAGERRLASGREPVGLESTVPESRPVSQDQPCCAGPAGRRAGRPHPPRCARERPPAQQPVPAGSGSRRASPLVMSIRRIRSMLLRLPPAGRIRRREGDFLYGRRPTGAGSGWAN